MVRRATVLRNQDDHKDHVKDEEEKEQPARDP